MSDSFSVCNKLGISIKPIARNSLKQSKKYKHGLNNVNMVRKLIFFPFLQISQIYSSTPAF